MYGFSPYQTYQNKDGYTPVNRGIFIQYKIGYWLQ